MFLVQEGFTYRNFPAGRRRDILLCRVVMVAHDCCLRSIPTPRCLRLDQAKLGDWVYNISILFVDLYLIFQGTGMAERNQQQARQARDQPRSLVGFSVADEIEKLGRLKQAASISDAKFARLRARLVQ